MKPILPSAPQFDLEGFLPYLLHRAAVRTGGQFETICRATAGLDRAEWRVLAHLGQASHLSAADICAAADLHKTLVSRVVERLSTRGLLIRQTDPEDRRRERLSLSEEGRDLLDRLAIEAMRFDGGLTTKLGRAERLILARVLVALADINFVSNETT